MVLDKMTALSVSLMIHQYMKSDFLKTSHTLPQMEEREILVFFVPYPPNFHHLSECFKKVSSHCYNVANLNLIQI